MNTRIIIDLPGKVPESKGQELANHISGLIYRAMDKEEQTNGEWAGPVLDEAAYVSEILEESGNTHDIRVVVQNRGMNGAVSYGCRWEAK